MDVRGTPHVTRVRTETGRWCSFCLLPSVVEQSFEPVGGPNDGAAYRVMFCTDCGQSHSPPVGG